MTFDEVTESGDADFTITINDDEKRLSFTGPFEPSETVYFWITIASAPETEEGRFIITFSTQP